MKRHRLPQKELGKSKRNPNAKAPPLTARDFAKPIRPDPALTRRLLVRATLSGNLITLNALFNHLTGSDFATREPDENRKTWGLNGIEYRAAFIQLLEINHAKNPDRTARSAAREMLDAIAHYNTGRVVNRAARELSTARIGADV